MEEEAELELLEQHLHKTNRLSTQMTQMLSRLDTRLQRLEKTITPFGLSQVIREGQNIDVALAILGGKDVQTKIIKNEFAVGKAEEDIIQVRPEYSNLEAYTGAIDRVLKEVERLAKNDLRSSEETIRNLSRLIDLGARNLGILAIKLVKDGSSQAVNVQRIIDDGALSGASLLPTFPLSLRVFSYLSKLPTSSSHPASSSIQSSLSSIADQYAAARRDYIISKYLQPMIKTFNKFSDAPMSPVRGAEERRDRCNLLGTMVDDVLALLQSESFLLQQLLPKAPPSTLSSIVSMPISMINDLLTSQITVIKRSLSTKTFYAFELYEMLLRYQHAWSQAVAQYLPTEREMQGMIGEIATGLRSVCTRSFPELLVDIKMSREDVSSSEVAKATYTTVTYLETLPTYAGTVKNLLTQLGERNWLMGATQMKTPVLGADDGIVQQYIADLLTALIENLETTSAGLKRSVKPIFMLNNLSYMRTHLILSTTPASDGLGDAGEDTLNRAFREHRQRFLDMWKSLISILDDHNITGGSRGFTSVVGSGDKQNVKDSLGAFFGRYEELEAACKQHPLTRQDPTLREKLAAETRGLVTDALQSYANRHQKHVEKYMRYSPSELDSRIAALLR